jgi:hypothetical protein
MGLGNVCGEFDVLGVERFLADLRTYGKGDNHPQQAVIARMIELSEDFLSEDFLSSQSPDIYTELEKAVKTTYDLLLLDWCRFRTHSSGK